MHNVVLSPIDPEKLISNIAEKVTENLLKAMKELPNSTEDNSTEKLLTVEEAAKFLSLSIATIYTKKSKGELPFMKRGKRVYFSSTELLKYLKEGQEKTNKEIDAEAEAYIAKNRL